MTALVTETEIAARPVRLTSGDFELLYRAGALDRLDRAELRDGLICEMNPQFTDHAYVKDELNRSISVAVKGVGLTVFSEASLLLDTYNMPAPDLALCEPFLRGGPVPLASVRMLVEVAVNTLADDLGRKRALYAGAGVAEYWVVDVLARAVHVFATPDRQRAVYAEAGVVPFGAALAARSVPGLVIDTTPLL